MNCPVCNEKITNLEKTEICSCKKCGADFFVKRSHEKTKKEIKKSINSINEAKLNVKEINKKLEKLQEIQKKNIQKILKLYGKDQ